MIVKNIGTPERIGRLLSGIVFLALAFFVRSQWWFCLPLLLLGALGFFQAAVGM